MLDCGGLVEPMNLDWQKQSYKRWSARIGPLSIEIRLIGIRGDEYWTVGEVFGVFHHGLPRDERLSLEEAQGKAERIAVRLLAETVAAARAGSFVVAPACEREEEMSAETKMKMLDCGEHGMRPWKGHVVCAACGAVYQTSDPEAPRYAPPTCTCSAQLMPKKKGDARFTARSICESCYAQRCGEATPP